MAEIKLERKGTPIWPFIVGLLLIAALLWYLLGRNADTATTTADTTAVAADTTGAMAGAGSATAGEDFAAFIGRNDSSGETEENHQYTAAGVRSLATSIERAGGAGAAAAVQTMRTMADSLQITSADSDRHADMAKRAFQAAVGAMGSGTGTAEARTAAETIDVSQPLLSQIAKVRTFFERARDAVGAMSPTGAR